MNKVFEKIIEKQEELFQDLNVIEVLSHVDFDSTIQNSLENFLKAVTNEAIEIVKQEAAEYKECCKDCKECEAYDKEKYHCPKFCKVIKEAVKEIEENNNDWISCSEKLPDLRKDVLVTVKYTGFMGMHGYWIKTGHMEAENDWWGDCAGGEVIAWMELPSAYRPKEK